MFTSAILDVAKVAKFVSINNGPFGLISIKNDHNVWFINGTVLKLYRDVTKEGDIYTYHGVSKRITFQFRGNTVGNVFKYLLQQADAVTVDDGPYLSSWIDDEYGYTFEWESGGNDYSESLGNEPINKGKIVDGTFIGENDKGERIVIKFYKIEQIEE